MKQEVVCTGKTVQDAIDAALAELGRTADEVEVEVLELPKKGGLFGLRKGTDARVRVTYAKEMTKAEAAQGFVSDVLQAMGIDGSVDVKQEAESIVLSLNGEDIGSIIGRRGGTLAALQYLTGLVANRVDGGYCRITLDCENYREKREKTLEALARRLAQNVARTGKSVTLEPMNPYERRIIHATVQKIPGTTSSSIGDEPNRRVVIHPVGGARRPVREGGDDRRDRGGRSGGYRGERRDDRREQTPKQQQPADAPAPETAPEPPLYSKIEIE